MGLAARACSPRRRQLLADLYIRKYQQSSYKSIMARVLLLASAAALRPTLPRRSRTTTRAALTMHDYDYDVIIVGCGVGGHGAALNARSKGLKTCVLSGGDVGGN